MFAFSQHSIVERKDVKQLLTSLKSKRKQSSMGQDVEDQVRGRATAAPSGSECISSLWGMQHAGRRRWGRSSLRANRLACPEVTRLAQTPAAH